MQHDYLVVSTRLKNISQIGSFPQIGMNIKNVWNHHLDERRTKNPSYFMKIPVVVIPIMEYSDPN